MCLDPCKAGHTLPEREVAVDVDGMCPLCMGKRITELEAAAVENHDVRCAAESWWRWERQFTACIPECQSMRAHFLDVLQWIMDGKCCHPIDDETAVGGPRNSEKAAEWSCTHNNEGDTIGGEGVKYCGDILVASKPREVG